MSTRSFLFSTIREVIWGTASASWSRVSCVMPCLDVIVEQVLDDPQPNFLIHVAMPLGGESLAEVVFRDDGKPWDLQSEGQWTDYMTDACRGLAFLHDTLMGGLGAHLDIKPDNFVFVWDARLGRARLVLADLGFARLASLHPPDSVVGALPYRSPEALIVTRGTLSASQAPTVSAAGPSTDMWSLGVVFWTIVSRGMARAFGDSNMDDETAYSRPPDDRLDMLREWSEMLGFSEAAIWQQWPSLAQFVMDMWKSHDETRVRLDNDVRQGLDALNGRGHQWNKLALFRPWDRELDSFGMLREDERFCRLLRQLLSWEPAYRPTAREATQSLRRVGLRRVGRRCETQPRGRHHLGVCHWHSVQSQCSETQSSKAQTWVVIGSDRPGLKNAIRLRGSRVARVGVPVWKKPSRHPTSRLNGVADTRTAWGRVKTLRNRVIALKERWKLSATPCLMAVLLWKSLEWNVVQPTTFDKERTWRACVVIAMALIGEGVSKTQTRRMRPLFRYKDMFELFAICRLLGSRLGVILPRVGHTVRHVQGHLLASKSPNESSQVWEWFLPCVELWWDEWHCQFRSSVPRPLGLECRCKEAEESQAVISVTVFNRCWDWDARRMSWACFA